MTVLLETDCLQRYREMLRVGVAIPLEAQQALIVHIDGLSELLERERAAVRRQAETLRQARSSTAASEEVTKVTRVTKVTPSPTVKETE